MTFPVDLYVMVCKVSSIVILASGLFAWISRRGMLTLSWLLLSSLVSGYVFLYSLQITSADPVWAYRFAVAEFVPVAFVTPAYFLFILVLTNKLRSFHGYLWASIILSILLVVGVVSGNVFTVGPRGPFVSHFIPLPGYLLNIANLMTFPTIAVGIMIAELRNSHGQKASQLLYVIVASVIGFLSAESVIPIAYNLPFLPYPMFFFWLYPLIIAYSIIKHRLMDITVVIRKSIIYSVTVGIFTAILLVGVFLISQYFSTMIGAGSVAVSIFTLSLAGLTFQPLRAGIEYVVDRIFFKRRYVYSQALQKLTGLFASASDTPQLEMVIHEVQKTVGARSAALFLRSSPDALLHPLEMSGKSL